jgi:hypothetical protein
MVSHIRLGRVFPMSNDYLSSATVDDFIDVIMKDHRKYIKW